MNEVSLEDEAISEDALLDEVARTSGEVAGDADDVEGNGKGQIDEVPSANEDEPLPDGPPSENEEPTFLEEELPPDFWDIEPVAHSEAPERAERNDPGPTAQPPTAPNPVADDASVLEHLTSLFPGRIVRVEATESKETATPSDDDESTQLGLFD